MEDLLHGHPDEKPEGKGSDKAGDKARKMGVVLREANIDRHRHGKEQEASRMLEEPSPQAVELR